jgi:glyoxylase-like metal-dependent hydrolase (beta-lactamase superfamily II)
VVRTPTVLRPDDPAVPALHTRHGGSPVHLDLGRVLLSKASVSEQDNCCYVLTSRTDGAQVLVDAADDARAVLALVDQAADVASQDVLRGRGRDLRLVVTSHGHWDHHRALPQVLAATGARSCAGRADADDLPVPPDQLLDHGDELVAGALRLRVVHLRGHTPGSVALVLAGADDRPAVAITGDSLFPGGVGNTWKDPRRFASLLVDVETRLFDALPDRTLVLPGHGDGTTLGAQRPSLPQWRRRGW